MNSRLKFQFLIFSPLNIFETFNIQLHFLIGFELSSPRAFHLALVDIWMPNLKYLDFGFGLYLDKQRRLLHPNLYKFGYKYGKMGVYITKSAYPYTIYLVSLLGKVLIHLHSYGIAILKPTQSVF